MKKIFLALLFPALLAAGCFDDKGNYDYGDEEVITIEGIEDVYTVETRRQVLEINPVVNSNKPAEWEYGWGYMDNFTDYIPVSSTKDLSHVFDLDPRQVTMLFRAKNTKTGVEKIIPFGLTLVTPYSRGWYVLKDNGTDSDFNFYPSADGCLPDDGDAPWENVLAQINGKSMPGVADKFMYTSYFKLDNIATRVFMVTTKDDFGVFLGSTLERVRDRDNMAFEPMPVVKPGMNYIQDAAAYLVNEGKLYTISLSSANTGRFGLPKQLDVTDPDYFLSGWFAQDPNVSMGFDEVSSSFIGMSYSGNIQYCTDGANSEVGSRNNNLTCLYFGRCVSSAVGVFADKTTGARSLLKMNFSNSPTISVVSALTAADKLNAASIMTVSNDDEVIYFVDAQGDVYSRILNEGVAENLEFDVPADETVTFVRPVRHRDSTLPLNYIAVATVKGSGASATYTVRFFPKLGGRFEDEHEDIRLTGPGYAKDVNFINPSMGAVLFHYDFYIYK